MFDIWWGDINLAVLIPVISVPFLLSIQLLLCFKVESLFLRLFPMGLFAAAGGWFFVLGITIPGWDSLGYTILAICAAFMLFICALGWGIWALCLWNKKRRLQ